MELNKRESIPLCRCLITRKEGRYETRQVLPSLLGGIVIKFGAWFLQINCNTLTKLRKYCFDWGKKNVKADDQILSVHERREMFVLFMIIF